MITTFLFDLLPVWLAKLAAAARSSGIYRLLSAIYRRCAELVRSSLLGRLWQGSERLRGWVDGSLLCALADGLLEWMTAFAGKLFGRLVPPLRCCGISSALGRLPRYNFAWFYGIIFLVCYVCPGHLWRNQYALVLSVLLFGAMLLDAWSTDRVPFRARDLGLWFFGFMAASALAIVSSANRGESIRVFCFFLTSYLLCMSLVGIVTNRGRLMAILGFMYAALIITGAVGIAQRIIGVEADALLTDLSANAGMPGRIYSTLDNPNNYAEFIVLTFPLSLVFCANIVDRRWKTLTLASLVIPVGALLMTYSRSGWLSFALAAVIFLALHNKRLLPLLGIAALLMVPLLPDSVFNRILTIGNLADSSNAYRLHIWNCSLQIIRDYGPAGIGLGPENFTPLYLQYCGPNMAVIPHSHMLFLEVWLEMGLLGIVSFGMLYLGTLRRCILATKRADPLLDSVLFACVSALGGISFGFAAEYVWFYPRVMFAFFIVLGVALAAIKLAEDS